MIVTLSEKHCPKGKIPPLREPVAVWNQAWFSSLRSAMGVFRYAMQCSDENLMQKALMTKELALEIPQKDGLFDSVVTPGVGKRSWEEIHLGNSNRNPITGKLEKSPQHILDMSWTCLQMLTWYTELEKDERLLNYSVRYAERLLSLQDEEGFFPAWIDKNGNILSELKQSSESAASASFLLTLYEITKDARFSASALRSLSALCEKVLPESRWEDFETYWSCSTFGADMQGKKYLRNDSYKQCSLSPFYMADALLRCYNVTGDTKWLEFGEICLDEMLMFQSSYQPKDIPITVVGGFGVMNGDGELLDARQSMFAETIIKYGYALNNPEYIERGCAALRASFVMMYCPENPIVKVQWEKKWDFLDEEDYGFMMENYGHGGRADTEGEGIGEFTIYDWGNGAASEALMRIASHYPELFPGFRNNRGESL